MAKTKAPKQDKLLAEYVSYQVQHWDDGLMNGERQYEPRWLGGWRGSLEKCKEIVERSIEYHPYNNGYRIVREVRTRSVVADYAYKQRED